jgi:serine/threonine protein phosphatase PrpC
VSRLRSGSATDRGRVRPINQDRVVVSNDLVAVADGMGGHVGGEVAARTAIETLLTSFGDQRSSDGLVTAVQAANRAIWEESRTRGDLRGMGTTLTAAALVDDNGEQHLTLVNVGDSRAYLFEDGNLTQLTQDHSLVEEMVRHGELTAAEASTHPHRHILTRALGIDRGVEIDAWQLSPPDGGRVLLCSDGLTNELSEGEIADILAAVDDPDEAAADLVSAAVDHGGNDNVSAVVVDVLSDTADPLAPPARERPERPVDHSPPSRKSGPAGHTEGLTGVVPAVPLSIAPSRGPGDGADRDGKGPDEGTGTTAVPAVTGAPSGSTIAVPAVQASRPADATAAIPAAGRREERPGGSPRSDMLIHRALNASTAANAVANGSAAAQEDDEHRPMLLVAPKRERPGKRERLLSLRVVLFSLALVGTLGGAVGVVGWFVESSYFVGLQQGHVVIYHGRPGGLLWFKPSVIERTALTTTDLIPPEVPPLQAGIEESSLTAAKSYVNALADNTALIPLFESTTTVPSGTVPVAQPLTGKTTTTLPPTTLPPSTTTTSPPPPPSSSTSTTTPKSTTTTTKPTKSSTTTTTTTPPTTTTKPTNTGTTTTSTVPK